MTFPNLRSTIQGGGSLRGGSHPFDWSRQKLISKRNLCLRHFGKMFQYQNMVHSQTRMKNKKKIFQEPVPKELHLILNTPPKKSQKMECGYKQTKSHVVKSKVFSLITFLFSICPYISSSGQAPANTMRTEEKESQRGWSVMSTVLQ